MKALVELHTADCDILGFTETELRFADGKGRLVEGNPVKVDVRQSGRLDHVGVHLVEIDRTVNMPEAFGVGGDIVEGQTVTCLFPDALVISAESEHDTVEEADDDD